MSKHQMSPQVSERPYFYIIFQKYHFKTRVGLLTKMISSSRVSFQKELRTRARTRWWGRRSSSAWRSSRLSGRSSSGGRTCSRRTSSPVSGKDWTLIYSCCKSLENNSYHWPNGVLYYTIDAEFDATERATIAAGMKMVEDNSCIRFKMRL